MDINFRNNGIIVRNTQIPAEKISSKPADNLEKREVNSGQEQVSNLRLSNNMQFNLNLLSRNQQILLIRELLNMPKELKELLLTLLQNNSSADKESGNINILLIKELLENNSKDLTTKLIKLLQSMGNPENNEKQFEILKLAAHLIPNAKTNPQEILNNLLVLYIPWFNTNQELNYRLELKERNQNEDEESQSSIIIYISTENIGKFKILLSINPKNQITSEIEWIEISDETKELRDQLIKEINILLKSNKITATTLTYKVNQENTSNKDGFQVSIKSESTVSSQLILAAQSIIDAIKKFDENLTLIKTRQEKINKN